MPPLRERTEDIAPLVHHFVRKFSREMGRSIDTISAGTMDALQKWPWPGNIRELENVIERAVILSSGTAPQVPASAFQGGPPARPAGAAAGAAARLGLKRTTLHSKMRKLGIERPSF